MMPFIWFLLILLCLLLYVTLDGYDLGLGIATLFERDPGQRRQLVELVAPAWDGNETWLVLLAVSLWAGLPLAYGTILPHAYLAVIVMLLALIVRGVSVEIASQNPPAPGWVRAFGVGSLIAALMQGVVVSTLAASLPLTDGAFSGSTFGAFGWFSALAAATVAAGYLALGHAYTKWKTTGEVRAKAGRRGFAAAVVAAVLGAASLGAVNATAAPLNLSGPSRAAGFAWLLAFAVAGVAMTLVTIRPGSRFDGLPLAGLVIATVAGVLALVVARYPLLAPPSLTVDAAASPGTTMDFLAVGVGLNVPLLLFYTYYAHYAFRGKQLGTPEAVIPPARGGAPRPTPEPLHEH
ncbi:MAG: cytochrome bd ubiquinol oxidase subunit [Mycobacteriales bacterium]